jgi:hypothetical protein
VDISGYDRKQHRHGIMVMVMVVVIVIISPVTLYVIVWLRRSYCTVCAMKLQADGMTD